MSNILDAMNLLFPRTRQSALAVLLLEPSQTFHLRELGRLTGIHAGTLLRELEKLEKVGLVIRVNQGNQARFEANQASPLFADLASMFRKTHGVAALLRQALAPLDRKISLALVFGSMARGTHASGSDVDLLVVGSVGFAALVKALYPVQESLGREINPVLYSAEEFDERLKRGESFLKNIASRPMVLIKGGRDDFEKLAGDKPPAGTPG